VKIRMFNDEGVAVGEFAAHACEGNLFHCETPASCEECGADASIERVVYVWTDDRNIEYWACEACLAGDQYAKVVDS